MRFVFASLLLIMETLTSIAQENCDSLGASRIVSRRDSSSVPGSVIFSLKGIQSAPSPLGMGDIYKRVQLQPGVTMGAEGFSSIQVRGANNGNNRVTLDGVNLYGGTHLLGLTFALSQDIIGNTEFRVGGFRGEDGDLTSSHIAVTSRDCSFATTTSSIEASNYLLGGYFSTPVVYDRLSVMCAFRYSPIEKEYAAARPVIERFHIGLNDFKASVYDIYGKVQYAVTPERSLSLSIFNSHDRYGLYMAENDETGIEYSNLLSILRYESVDKRGVKHNISFSFSGDNSHNKQIVYLTNNYNCLEVKNFLKEMAFSASSASSIGEHVTMQTGIKALSTQFNIGTVRGDGTHRLLLNAYAQAKWHYGGHHLMTNIAESIQWLTSETKSRPIFAPDFDAAYEFKMPSGVSIQATMDYKHQFFHVLEGLPLGWSLDLYVPADVDYLPESSTQVYTGAHYVNRGHDLRVGAYYKVMRGLVCLIDPSLLFSPSLVGWKSLTEKGEGSSYGMEMMYDGTFDYLHCSLSYTLSKTDRQFGSLNQGVSFPARYDRRHVLNASFEIFLFGNRTSKVSYRNCYTFQSGHWETIANCSFSASSFLTGGSTVLQVASALNDTKMPNYSRWDNYLSFTISNKRLTHDFQLGVYNTLNRHNPSFVFYSEDDASWKSLSLIPIMPTISYKLSW